MPRGIPNSPKMVAVAEMVREIQKSCLPTAGLDPILAHAIVDAVVTHATHAELGKMLKGSEKAFYSLSGVKKKRKASKKVGTRTAPARKKKRRKKAAAN